jgi:hypothetical protein
LGALARVLRKLVGQLVVNRTKLLPDLGVLLASGFRVEQRTYPAVLDVCTAMSKRKRIKEKKTKALSPEELATPDQTPISRRFAPPYDKARLLIEHPHSYREWNIVGRWDVPVFFTWNHDSG